MLLSNLRKSFLPAGLCLIVSQGCGGPSAANQAVPVQPLAERKSGFPFSTREPEIYQGEIVIDGDEANRSFVARKAGRWREDRYQDGHLLRTELFADQRYSIDHERKIYAAHEQASNGIDSFAGMPADLLKGKEQYEFDEVAREGTVLRYKVRMNKYMHDDILIDIDTASGMIVRQEFRTAAEPPDQAGYVYEMRNLKLEVDDRVFDLPAGYKKVDRDEFYSKTGKKS